MKPCKKCGAADRNTSGKCRPCQKVRSAKHYSANLDEYIHNARDWKLNHPDRVKESNARSYAADPEKFNARTGRWKLMNPDKVKVMAREYEARRYSEDLDWRLRKNLRSRLRRAIKNNHKFGSAVSDLGCSIEDLKVYLEKKFQPGMTWDNWGNGDSKWNIDHIEPLAKFDLEKREEFLRACHYTNLQPLWWKLNMEKGAKEDVRPAT